MKSFRFLGLVYFVCLLLTRSATGAVTLTTSDEGIVVDAGATGQFTLRLPILSDDSGAEKHKIVQKSKSDKTLTVGYEGGGQVAITVKDSGEVRYEFSYLRGDVTHCRVDTVIPLTYSQGGKWRIGDKEGVFPQEIGADSHLHMEHSQRFELIDAQGTKLLFETPQYTYLDMNDNRLWRWPVFDCVVHVPINRDALSGAIKISADVSATRSGATVDPLGQLKALDFPMKIRSVDELQADVQSEKEYPQVIPSLDGNKYACKRALADFLRKRHPTPADFTKAWEIPVKSLDKLTAAPLVARTRVASEDVQAFMGEFFETSFKLGG